MPPKCPGTKPDGTACRAPVADGATWCRWHDPTPEGRARHLAESKRGGLGKAYNALQSTDPVAGRVDLGREDLSSPGGIGAVLAGTLAALCELPFDTRVAHAIANVANVQRATAEAAHLEKRLAALEQAVPSWR